MSVHVWAVQLALALVGLVFWKLVPSSSRGSLRSRRLYSCCLSGMLVGLRQA